MARLKTVALNSILVVGALAVAFAAALAVDSWLNLGLRFAIATLFQKSIQEPEPIMYVYDNDTGWRLNPRTQYHRSLSGPFFGLAGLQSYDTRLRVNSDGFLDREHYVQTPYYRIAFLGNSWVEAVQQQFESRFAPLTEDYVHDQSKGSKVVEIMNFGVSNGAPAHSYGVIRSYMAKYHPDEAWLFVTAADIRANTPIDTQPPFGGTFVYADAGHTQLTDIRFGYVDPPAYVRAKRVQAMKDGTVTDSGFAPVMTYHYSTERNPTYDRVWNDMRLVMGLVKRTLDAQGTRMRMVYIPPRYEVDPRLWEQWRAQAVKAAGRELALDPSASERRFAELARALGVEFVSLVPLCKEKGPAEMFGDHFSRMGHHWVADYLARLVIQTVPDSPKTRPQ